ncbi:hypothetical protein KC980_04380, partial [candidate division WWE3 bacterium]|nr:hypothetical protein [candidate division WWE3 bacterium]
AFAAETPPDVCAQTKEERRKTPFQNIQEENPGIDIARTGASVDYSSTSATIGSWMCGASVESCIELGCDNINELSAGRFPDAERMAAKGLKNRGLALMGYRLAEAVDRKDAIPVSYAYWYNDVVGKVPYVGQRALAQTDYKIFGAELVYTLWVQIRNIAYGLLSVGLIVTGVMIMTRRQLPTKTAVTAQYALPRLVLGVVLITFSYFIGATAVAMIAPLKSAASWILINTGHETGAIFTIDDFNLSNGMNITSAFFTQFFTVSPRSAIASLWLTSSTLVVAGIVALCYLIFYMIAVARTFLVQLQIMGSIVMAPLTFAWGTIPGNEKVITDWFKLLGARVLAIPAMFFVLSISNFLVLVAFTKGLSTLGTVNYEVGEGLKEIAAIWMVPFIAVSIMIGALRIPKKLENSFLGKK